jgi:ribonuclease HI
VQPPYDLNTLAFKGERTEARLLARRAGITESEALRRVLDIRAGAVGLAALLDGRCAQREADVRQRADRTAANAARLALKKMGPAIATDTWLAWFDGSALPNPGRIGIGAVLLAPDGRRTQISRRAGDGDSGEAEYLALIAVLEAALDASATESIPGLLIRGDSRVVIDDLLAPGPGAASLAGYRLRARELIALLEAGMDGARVTVRWIPRHKNAEADRLSALARGTLS